MVIDCCSIHSSSVKMPQPDLAAFFFIPHSHKMVLGSSHQQHVFNYKRIVPHTVLDCLPNCSPVAHTPGITHVPDTTSHLLQCQWATTLDIEVPGLERCSDLLKKKPIETKSPYSANNFIILFKGNLKKEVCCQSLSIRGNRFDTFA